MNQDKNLILIVDDNQKNLKLLFDLLDAYGYEILVAKSAESALNKLKNISPDLILMDVMMLGIDGFEACRILKEKDTTKDIPLMFITALSDTESKLKGLKLGAVDYITKPFHYEEVLVRVRNQIELYHLKQKLEQKVAARTNELNLALSQLQTSQVQLVQNEKLSALGQLVAGVAHEINNPLACIKGNAAFLEDYFSDLLSHIEFCHHVCSNVEITKQAKNIHLEEIVEELPKVLTSINESVDRISNLSISLRNFSRQDSANKVAFNIHEGIDSTLVILNHRLNANDKHPAIEVIKDYGTLPDVQCFPGQINQVFMNILANAIDAVEKASMNFDKNELRHPQINIYTELSKDKTTVDIRIQDNGIGMSNEIKNAIFDYLFTTKPIGKGTGLGLSIAHQIIVEKHGGCFKVDSVLGKGSEFIISIPVKANELAYHE